MHTFQCLSNCWHPDTSDPVTRGPTCTLVARISCIHEYTEETVLHPEKTVEINFNEKKGQNLLIKHERIDQPLFTCNLPLLSLYSCML